MTVKREPPPDAKDWEGQSQPFFAKPWPLVIEAGAALTANVSSYVVQYCA
jgi:hypothetical protein